MLADLELLAIQRTRSDEAWKAAIIAASAAGVPMRQIATAAGVSTARVHQIVHGK